MQVKIDTRNNIFLRRNDTSSNIALWCLPGFADSNASFLPLFKTALAQETTLITPDLPGFGASPKNGHAATIAEYAATLRDLIEHVSPGAEIGLIGHSVGSVIAAETAQLLGKRCRGVFSIEGNVTVDDAYFSGRAVEFENAADFKDFFTDHIWQRGAKDAILRAYLAGLLQADAAAMWAFGRDVKAYSQNDRPGHVLLSLDCPVQYFWCGDNTPASTQKFIKDNTLANIEVSGTSHWPMLDAPDKVADSLKLFFNL